MPTRYHSVLAKKSRLGLWCCAVLSIAKSPEFLGVQDLYHYTTVARQFGGYQRGRHKIESTGNLEERVWGTWVLTLPGVILPRVGDYRRALTVRDSQ